MSYKIIFGYGSLINQESLRLTVPDAYDLQPAFIKGFVREFSLWDPNGWTETNLDLKGIPFCSLDIKTSADPTSEVNGVIFKVNGVDFEKLAEREQEYKLIETNCYDFNSGDNIGRCFVFSANKNNGTYAFNEESQRRYLKLCLEGASQYGQKFLEDFKRTTFINGASLVDLAELGQI